jgi:hypothetical protein
MIGELVIESDDAIARLPVNATREKRDSVTGVLEESDIGGLTVDEASDLGADPIEVVEPLQEVGTGECVAAISRR